MWADAQRDGRRRNGANQDRKFRNSLSCPTPQFDCRPLLECRAVTLPIEERKTWSQGEFLHLAKFR